MTHPSRFYQILFVVLTNFLVYSCAGFSPNEDLADPQNSTPGQLVLPPELSHTDPPTSAAGIFLGRDAAGGSVEDGSPDIDLRLYDDGRAFIRIRWPGDGMNHADTGSYRYNPDSGKIWVKYAADSPDAGFVSSLTGEPASFAVGRVVFVRIAENPLPDKPVRPDNIAGNWEMEYHSAGEESLLTLVIGEGGSFTELNSYGNGTDLLSETGTWFLDEVSGLVTFSFNLRPEADFIALYDTTAGTISAPEGDFHR